MRKILANFKVAVILLGALSCALFAFALWQFPVFGGGESYELYLGDSSSAQILSSQNPALDKLLHTGVKGESVRYSGDLYAEIKARFHAELLFTEEAADVTNYYLYAPALGDGLLLAGERVNLHIAVGHGQTAAGTPIIFGGF